MRAGGRAEPGRAIGFHAVPHNYVSTRRPAATLPWQSHAYPCTCVHPTDLQTSRRHAPSTSMCDMICHMSQAAALRPLAAILMSHTRARVHTRTRTQPALFASARHLHCCCVCPCAQGELQQAVDRFTGELSAMDEQCQGYFQQLVELGVAAGQPEAQRGSEDGVMGG